MSGSSRKNTAKRQKVLTNGAKPDYSKNDNTPDREHLADRYDWAVERLEFLLKNRPDDADAIKWQRDMVANLEKYKRTK